MKVRFQAMAVVATLTLILSGLVAPAAHASCDATNLHLQAGGGTVDGVATVTCVGSYTICLQNNNGNGWSSRFDCSTWTVDSGAVGAFINTFPWNYSCGVAYRTTVQYGSNAWTVSGSRIFC